MSEKKKPQTEKKNKGAKTLTKPGNIKGKIEVSDVRERRDGPGGNETQS